MKNRIFLTAIFALMFNFSVQAQPCTVVEVAPMKADPETNPEAEKGSWTEKVTTGDGAFTVIIHQASLDEADNLFRAGPVDVLDKEGKKICTAEIESLYPQFAIAGNKYFYYASGDATYISLNALDLHTCQVVWSSPNYSWLKYPKIETNAVVLAGKKYTFTDQCLPNKKSTPQK